jgi:hypothetical protein
MLAGSSPPAPGVWDLNPGNPPAVERESAAAHAARNPDVVWRVLKPFPSALQCGVCILDRLQSLSLSYIM